MLRVLCEKGYEQGICLYGNLNFRKEMAFGYCCVLFGIVILRKGDSAKVFLHYFSLFCTVKK